MKERECYLSLDEMSLKMGLQYDRSARSLSGDGTLPGHSGSAPHALVFMLGGISTRWKQTVGYNFTGNSVNGTFLKPLVIEKIEKAKNIGLHVSTITTDMGSANQSVMSSLGMICSCYMKTVNKIHHLCEESQFLHMMYDVPHLVKKKLMGMPCLW